MSTKEAPRPRRFDGLRKLMFGETAQEPTTPQPAQHERWQVEEWKRLLATRTPEEIATQGPDPKYLVRHQLRIPEKYREGSTTSFAVAVNNPAFAEDLTRDGEWSGSVYPIIRPLSGAIGFGNILCRPGTDKNGAIEAVDEWIRASFPTVLQRTETPIVKPTDTDPAGLGRELEKHFAIFTYQVELLQ